MNDDDDPSQDTCDQSQLDDILDNALQQLSSGDLDPTSALTHSLALSGSSSGRLPISKAALVFFALLSAKGTSPLIKDNDPVDSVTYCTVPLAKTCDPTPSTTATKRKRVQEQDISDDSDDSAVTPVISRKAVTKRRRRNLTE